MLTVETSAQLGGDAPECANLVLFVDRELSPEEADSFRNHLGECSACGRDLAELVPLAAVIRSALESERESRNAGGGESC